MDKTSKFVCDVSKHINKGIKDFYNTEKEVNSKHQESLKRLGELKDELNELLNKR
jgi:hypothetical protein